MAEFLLLIPLWVWIGIGMIFLVMLALIPDLLAKRNHGRRSFAQGRRHPVPANSSSNIQISVPMVSYAEVKSDYDRKRHVWRVAGEQILNRLRLVQSMDYRAMDVPEVLRHATTAEKSNLTAILGIELNSEPVAIANALRKAGSNTAASLLRGSNVQYEEVARDVAVKLGSKGMPKPSTASELERFAVGAAMGQMLAEASPQERSAILTGLAKSQANSATGIATATGGLALANLSGFGLYIAASSSLAALTSAVGLTLPFAVYTGVSSVLATVTGPVGWAALALFAIIKVGGADYKKTVPGVIAIAASQARLIANQEDEIVKLNTQGRLHDESGRRLDVLANFVSGMERKGKNLGVPKSSVPW